MLPFFNKMSHDDETFSHFKNKPSISNMCNIKTSFLSNTMSVPIAGHSRVKYLNQYTQDPHVSCIARPGGQIRDFFPNK